MYIVYILKSVNYPNRHYVGFTTNLQKRLQAHNTNSTGYTKKYAPWEIETYITFENKVLAESFERYLKNGSGHAFLKKRLIL